MAMTIEHYKFVSSDALWDQTDLWELRCGRQCSSYFGRGKAHFWGHAGGVPIEFITGYCKVAVTDSTSALMRPSDRLETISGKHSQSYLIKVDRTAVML